MGLTNHVMLNVLGSFLSDLLFRAVNDKDHIKQTWNLSKILHRRIFRLKILHRQFHLILTVLVRKNTKNEWKWRNLHRWQKFYTAAGTDGTDKFQLWPQQPAQQPRPCDDDEHSEDDDDDGDVNNFEEVDDDDDCDNLHLTSAHGTTATTLNRLWWRLNPRTRRLIWPQFVWL